MKVKIARYLPEPDFYDQVHYRYLNKITSIIHCVQKSIGFVDGTYPCVITCGLSGPEGEKVVKYISNNKPQVLVIVGDPQLELQEKLQRLNIFRIFKVKSEKALSSFFIMHGKFLSACSLVLCGDEKYKEVKDYVQKRLYLNYSTLGFFDDMMFGLGHGINNLNRKYIDKIDKCDSCFVIGHGPSLINDIDVIKRSQVPIISCGSSIDSLYQNGITPDYEVLLERTPNMEQVFKNLPDEYLNKITLISTELLADMPKLKAFKDVLLFTKGDEIMHTLIDAESISMINPLVGNFGLRFGQKIANNVYLFGMDNGSRTDLGHCTSSKYYNNDKVNLDIRAKANFGGYVNTNWLYKLSATQMANAINGNVYNCSDGIFIENAIPLKAKFVKSDKPVIHYKLLDNIKEIKKSVSHDLKECRSLHYSLQKDLEILLGNLTRENIIKKLIVISEKIYDSGYFNRKVLNGLQSFFIETITSMFTVPLENDNLELAKFCIENTIEFLKECTSLLQKYQKLEFRDY